MELLLRLFLSLFIGAIVGLDRDSSWQTTQKTYYSRFSFIKPGKPAKGLGGVRTFTLISLLGFLSGVAFLVSPNLIFIGILSLLALIILTAISYFLNFFDKNTFGLTTEISLFILFIISFLLGANSIDYKILLAIAIAISLVLSLKVELRRFISTFTRREIIESIEFIFITIVVFPFLPDTNILLKEVYNYLNIAGPFADIVLFNPQKLWLVVIFISSLSFVGYFLVKLFKTNQSLLLTGFLGGIVSSTTVTQLMALKSKETTDRNVQNFLVSIALIANSTSFIRIPIIVIALNYPLFTAIALCMILMAIGGFGISLWTSKQNSIAIDSQLIFKSPLALKSALLFAFLFILVQIITQIGTLFFGNAGFAVTTVIASLSGLDAVSINTAQSVPGVVSIVFGAVILVTAVIVNLVFKAFLSFFTASNYFTRRLSFFFIIVSILGIIGLLVTIL